jgi:hypothetical protein
MPQDARLGFRVNLSFTSVMRGLRVVDMATPNDIYIALRDTRGELCRLARLPRAHDRPEEFLDVIEAQADALRKVLREADTQVDEFGQRAARMRDELRIWRGTRTPIEAALQAQALSEELLRVAVATERRRGLTWAAIAAELGVTRQAAFARFSGAAASSAR